MCTDNLPGIVCNNIRITKSRVFFWIHIFLKVLDFSTCNIRYAYPHHVAILDVVGSLFVILEADIMFPVDCKVIGNFF